MPVEARILGCGSSSGVPRLGLDGPDWGACDPREPRNRRTRCSLLVRTGALNLLIDTSPDLREQMLLAAVGNLRPIAHHADGMHQHAVLHCGVGQHQRHIGPGGAGADELVQGGLHRCQKAGAQHIVARHGAATQGQGRGHQAGHAIALGLLGRRG